MLSTNFLNRAVNNQEVAQSIFDGMKGVCNRLKHANYLKLIGEKMTKADIVEKIAEKCGIMKRESIDMVESSVF